MSDISMPSKPLTGEEMQKQINAKYSVILDKLRIHDQFGEDIKRLSYSDDLMFSLLKSQDEKIKDSHAKALSASADVVRQYDSDRSSLGASLVRQKHLEEALSDVKMRVDDSDQLHSSEVSRLLSSHDELAKKSMKKDEFTAHLQHYDSSIGSIRQDLAEHRSDISYLKSSLLMIQGKFDKVLSDYESLRKELKDHKDQHTSKISDFNQVIDRVLKDLDGKTDYLNQKFASDLKDHRETMDDYASSLEMLRQDQNSKISEVAMDAGNAVSRSTNIESQIKALDKKLDKAILMFNKYELAK